MREWEDEATLVEIRSPSEVEIKADLADRRTFIGGSDAPVILGLSPFKSPVQLWLEKTGQVDAEDISEVERVRWGILLEDIVAKEFSARTGKKVYRVNERQISRKYPWMVAQIDRRIVGGGILEVKTTGVSQSTKWGDEGTDQVPPNYLVQVMHQLAVTGQAFAELAVLIGGNQMRMYRVDRDEDLIEALIEAENEFWGLVQSKTPPDPMALGDANLLWGSPQQQVVVGDELDNQNVQAYQDLSAQIAKLEEQRDGVKLAIETAMKDIGDTLVFDGKSIATWKLQKRSKIDTKGLEASYPEIVAPFKSESSFRVLRVGK